MLKPIFLDGAKGRLFVQQFLPDSEQSGSAVLLSPPFAEELNKSRRMMALLGRSLAQCGHAVAWPDLYGTGDSGGDFADADWQVWKQDWLQVAQMLCESGIQRFYVVGLRMGCLLAADALRESSLPLQKLVFWQPVLSGKQMINQFLRLRVVLVMMSGQRESIADLRQMAKDVGEVEVAGYSLSNTLIESLDQLEMSDLLLSHSSPIQWFEILARTDQSLPLPVTKLQQALQSKGCDLNLDALVGESFWATQEIAELPQLVERTVQIMSVP